MPCSITQPIGTLTYYSYLLQSILEFLDTDRNKSVSYTHLDVYKRQICCKVKDLFGKMICYLDYFTEYCSTF